MRKIIFYLTVVVIGLISISIYSTYALFTTSVSSDTVINIESNLTYEFDINSEKVFEVGGNNVLHFNAIINNNTEGSIKYGIYHNYNLASNTNIKIGEIVANATTTTTSPKGVGTLGANTNVTVPIAIVNNSDQTITVSLGVLTGYVSNNLTYPANTYALTNTVDDDNIGSASCESNISYNEEDCYEEIINGIKYTRCIITTGQEVIPNLDISGANVPVLADGMIPVYHNGSSWAKADITNTNATHQWYDYNAKKWANAVMVTSGTRDTYMNAAAGSNIAEGNVLAYFVWIPRYKYQLFNVGATSMSPIEIQVQFENGTPTKSAGTSNEQWLTHPAFTFGSDELTGIWVGKFEASGSDTTPTIKPNSSPLVLQNVSTQFATSQKFGTTTYLTSTGITEVDAHMMKNIEWGAVAYLKQSKYGLGLTDIEINNYNMSLHFKPGCGPQSAGSTSSGTVCNAYNTELGQTASTTGNIYGVYDMSGGSSENVMGVMKDSAGTGLTYRYSGFTASTLPYGSKYVDQYAYGTTYNDQTAYNRRILGDATGETRGWYSDARNFVYSSNSWFNRGGAATSSSSAGVFCFDYWEGFGDDYTTFRPVIVFP